MGQVDVERVQEWLEQPQYPNAAWPSAAKRRNWQLNQLPVLTTHDLVDILSCAKEHPEDPDRFTVKHAIRSVGRGVVFRVEFDIANVSIVEVCSDGHDWGEWRYDFMGGDIRRCKRCDETEMS